MARPVSPCSVALTDTGKMYKLKWILHLFNIIKMHTLKTSLTP